MDSKRTKNIILSCGVILIVTCICLGLILVSGIGVSLVWPFGTRQESTLPTPIRVTQESSDPFSGETPAEENHLPEDLTELISLIESQVIQIRGLSMTGPVERTLITINELEDIVVNDFFSDYTDQDARQDVLILSQLGLVPGGFDLKEFYTDLYSEQISGFYDNETKEMFVVQGGVFGGGEKLTYAHEFTHVLQDQVYNFDEGLDYNEDSCEADSERCAAIQALIEGDASLTEISWFQTYATREDFKKLMETYDNFTSPIFDAAPPFMAADLYFPYEKGFAFVELLYNEGGFEAVDAAFQDLPVSTEQIMHPERYPQDAPQAVLLSDLSGVLGNEWTLFDQNIMGEWYTYLILNQAYDEDHRLEDALAEEAAEGWGGDSYAFYLNESTDEIVFVMDTIWDTAADAEEFASAFDIYAGLRWDVSEYEIFNQPTWFGMEGTIMLMLEGNRTVWIMTPTDALAESVISELR